MQCPLSHKTIFSTLFISMGALALATYAQSQNNTDQMSFFVTSVGKGDGGNIGGLEGADAHCGALATAAGSSKKWAAYLSTSMVVDRSGGRPFKSPTESVHATA